jgi:hypothetical protein
MLRQVDNLDNASWQKSQTSNLLTNKYVNSLTEVHGRPTGIGGEPVPGNRHWTTPITSSALDIPLWDIRLKAVKYG